MRTFQARFDVPGRGVRADVLGRAGSVRLPPEGTVAYQSASRFDTIPV
jgi:hypothetical protein